MAEDTASPGARLCRTPRRRLSHGLLGGRIAFVRRDDDSLPVRMEGHLFKKTQMLRALRSW